MFPLTLVHLRFTTEALTPLRLGDYQAGSYLRGALGNVIRRTSMRPVARCAGCWRRTNTRVRSGAGMR